MGRFAVLCILLAAPQAKQTRPTGLAQHRAFPLLKLPFINKAPWLISGRTLYGWAIALPLQMVTAPISLPKPGMAVSSTRGLPAAMAPLPVLHSLKSHTVPLVGCSRLPLTQVGVLAGHLPPISWILVTSPRNEGLHRLPKACRAPIATGFTLYALAKATGVPVLGVLQL